MFLLCFKKNLARCLTSVQFADVRSLVLMTLKYKF